MSGGTTRTVYGNLRRGQRPKSSNMRREKTESRIIKQRILGTITKRSKIT